MLAHLAVERGSERRSKGGEERGIQVILLLGEMDSFIITPLAWFLPGDGCKLTTSTCSWLSFIMPLVSWQIEQWTLHIQSLSTCTHSIIYARYIRIPWIQCTTKGKKLSRYL